MVKEDEHTNKHENRLPQQSITHYTHARRFLVVYSFAHPIPYVHAREI